MITLRAENDRPRSSSWCRSMTVDLLYRQSHGEIAMDVPVIVSNHEACRVIAEQYDIPFMYVPVESGVDERPGGSREPSERKSSRNTDRRGGSHSLHADSRY